MKDDFRINPESIQRCCIATEGGLHSKSLLVKLVFTSTGVGKYYGKDIQLVKGISKATARTGVGKL